MGGALIRRRGETLTLTRDPGARRPGRWAPAPAPLILPAGREIVWDGRVALNMAEPGWAVALEAGQAVLARGQARLTLAQVRPRWLLAERAPRICSFLINARKR